MRARRSLIVSLVAVIVSVWVGQVTDADGATHAPPDRPVAGRVLAQSESARVGALDFSTYLGGSAADEALAVAADADGAVYVTGWTASHDFPVTDGAYDTRHGGGDCDDAFVAKLDPSGRRLVFATYLGGAGCDRGEGIALAGDGAIWVAGATDSADFPVTPDALLPAPAGGMDGFLVRLSADGSAIEYGTYFGGNQDDAINDLDLGGDGEPFVAGATGSYDLPVTPGSYDTTYNRGDDAFAAQLSPDGRTLRFGTFIGGQGDDRAAAVAVDGDGAVFLTGATTSTDFPVSPRWFMGLTTPEGRGEDPRAFAVKLGPDGVALEYGGYVATIRGDEGAAVAVDERGHAFVTGQLGYSPELKTPGAVIYGNFTDGFVLKTTPDGTAPVYAANLGEPFHGHGDDSIATAVVVDAAGNALVAGQTNAELFPTTPNAVKPEPGPKRCRAGDWSIPCADGFLVRLNAAGTCVAHGTYLGGADDDAIADVAVAPNGDAVAVGWTRSSDFPLTLLAPDTELSGEQDAFVASVGVPGECVNVAGPARGRTGTALAFTAHSSLADRDAPVDYTWSATGRGETVDTGGASSRARFGWSRPGTRTITVTARSAVGATRVATRTVAVTHEIPVVGAAGGTPSVVAHEDGWAYVGYGARLALVDARDPAAMREVGSLLLPDAVQAIHVETDHVLVAAGLAGLWVVDVSDPSAPRRVGSATVPGLVTSVVADGDRAFLASWQYCVEPGQADCRVVIDEVDLSAPATPTVTGRLHLFERLGFVSNGLRLALTPGRLFVAAEGVHDDLSAIDVSVPGSPRRLPLPDISAVAVAARGQTVYAVSRIGEVTVLDAATSGPPTVIAEASRPLDPFSALAVMDAVAVEGRLLIAYHGTSYSSYHRGSVGFRVVDTRDAANLVDTGGYQVWTRGVPGIHLSGADGPVFLADGHSAVRVLAIADPADPAELGVLRSPGGALSVATGQGLLLVGEVPRTRFAYGSMGGSRTTYLGGGVGVYAVSESDPRRAPQALANYETGGLVKDIVTVGDHAYILVFGDYEACDPEPCLDGLHIVDLSDPRHPERVRLIELPPDASAGYPWRLRQGGGRVLQVGRSYVGPNPPDQIGRGRLTVLDVADPGTPVVAHDLRFDTTVLDAAASSTLVAAALERPPHTRLFAETGDGQIRQAGQIDAAGALAISGTLLFVAGHETFEVYDVSDPDQPSLIGQTDALERSWYADDYSLVVEEEQVFLSDANGVHVFDVRDPRRPVRVADLGTGSAYGGIGALGYCPSGHDITPHGHFVVAACGGAGLYTLGAVATDVGASGFLPYARR